VNDHVRPRGPSHALSQHEYCRERLREEFAEMPGLRLTMAQVARLLAVDRTEVERLMDELVTGGELSVQGGSVAVPASARR